MRRMKGRKRSRMTRRIEEERNRRSLGYDPMWSDRYLIAFWRNLQPPSSG
jgi:hypothetical protein